jgi:hypothetical protein
MSLYEYCTMDCSENKMITPDLERTSSGFPDGDGEVPEKLVRVVVVISTGSLKPPIRFQYSRP